MQLLALAVLLVIAGFIIKRLFFLITSKDKNNHLHDVTEDVALAGRVAAAIGGISMFLLAPAGLFAIFAKPPLIVVIAPALAIFAAGAYVVHALAKLYDKKRKKQGKA